MAELKGGTTIAGQIAVHAGNLLENLPYNGIATQYWGGDRAWHSAEFLPLIGGSLSGWLSVSGSIDISGLNGYYNHGGLLFGNNGNYHDNELGMYETSAYTMIAGAWGYDGDGEFSNYSYGNSAINVTYGKTGIGNGIDEPLGLLQIGAGNSSTPPLVMTPGSYVSTLVLGAIEFDGTNLWLTIN